MEPSKELRYSAVPKQSHPLLARTSGRLPPPPRRSTAHAASVTCSRQAPAPLFPVALLFSVLKGLCPPLDSLNKRNGASSRRGHTSLQRRRGLRSTGADCSASTRRAETRQDRQPRALGLQVEPFGVYRESPRGAPGVGRGVHVATRPRRAHTGRALQPDCRGGSGLRCLSWRRALSSAVRSAQRPR